MNQERFMKLSAEANAGFTQSDIDIFHDISLVAVSKIYTANVLDKIASIQTLDKPYGYIYYVDFKYGDDHAGESISAGDSMRRARPGKRTKDYGLTGEEVVPKRISGEVRQELIETDIRKYNISWTFESIIALQSVYGKSAGNFVDEKLVNVVSNKVRDELELSAIARLDAAVPVDHVFQFDLDTTETGCVDIKCHAKNVYKVMLEAAYKVHTDSGIMPNWIIVGNDALLLFESAEDFKIDYDNDMVPSGISRNYIGTLNKRFGLLYDPSMGSDILMGFKDPVDDMASTLVYAPYIPMGITPPQTEKDLSTYRTIFSVDQFKVVWPDQLARIELLNA